MQKTTFQPLQLWQQIHCKNCKWSCNPTSEAYQRCILAHIAINLEQLRLIIQQRTQHLAW